MSDDHAPGEVPFSFTMHRSTREELRQFAAWDGVTPERWVQAWIGHLAALLHADELEKGRMPPLSGPPAVWLEDDPLPDRDDDGMWDDYASPQAGPCHAGSSP